MNSSYHPFPPTHWSLIHRAGGGAADEPARRDALRILLTRYEPALRSYLRVVRRYPEDKAGDLLQSFIADKVLEQELLRHADENRGHFRTFLLTSLNHFVISRHRSEHAGDEPSLDVIMEPAAATPAPDAFIEAQWAKSLLHGVLENMREECIQSKRADIWHVFETRVLADILHDTPPLPYETLAHDLALKSPAQAANLLITAKRMYVRLLHAAVAEYEVGDKAIEEEIASLRAALAGVE